ncbi:hypothetical protein DCAR_0730183 [Daucus carota subsp. sativus]|uniref:Ribosomal RNA-processing protein 7 C-terminal domain-containing protein n=1 Tax=Daucus carota subsp. sativus TaxID=79200 RepID=A0A161ZRQ8_DAUCS|nr:PREDICTED: axoneme-associated protein mst101(2) [Daucus carota subsp. sativus]WOH10713.1 hypothetical protein DCAR_0730183 [Daucus carota subsp. sativus]
MGENKELLSKKLKKIKSNSSDSKKKSKNRNPIEKKCSEVKNGEEKVKSVKKIRKHDEVKQAGNIDEENRIDEASRRKKKRKVAKAKDSDKAEIISSEIKDSSDGDIEAEEKQRSKLRKLKRKGKKTKKSEIEKVNESDHEVEGSNLQKGKSKKVRKAKKVRLLSQDEDVLEDNEVKQDEVYEISSGDEDSSQGMKKWIMEYHQSRPGVKILQDKIDDFIVSHEAKLEQERKEREALAAEGGWTVVVHQKGRKKTTESESGTAVGAAHATVTDRIAKKKNKEVGLDFYRFQKREAQKSEIMMLQSKFEQDKKRIQQMRAARKFKPY